MKSSTSFQQKILGLQANLLSFAFQLTTNKEEAHDLLQDTTLKALDNEEKFVDNVNFKGWIFTIMRNIFINNYRQNAKQATVIDKSEDLFHLNLSQDSGLSTPEGSFAVKEISETLNAFPEEYRVPFNLYVAGYKYNEIAEKLNLPIGTVKTRIFIARKKLREQLKDFR
ncbi:MAG: RNA polymerase sigma factor [Muribaculaceae bacterium]|nr:RNA polymerase sigma factor [Muribaculaceae bacterium]